jgi:hypothetical protein
VPVCALPARMRAESYRISEVGAAQLV